MKDLLQCRQEIDEIDEQLIQLFEKRMSVAKDVVMYKIDKDMPIFQSDREKQVIEKNINRIQNEQLKKYAHFFIQDMMNISKSYQATFLSQNVFYDLKEPGFKNCIIGYQGVPGSFSEQALESFFDEHIDRKNYHDFEDVFIALKDGDIDYGVVPIENSSTGAINDNYDLIRDYGFYIVGEQSLSIAQHLLGIKGTSVQEITDVYSHPQGILQCKDFLHQHSYIQPHEYVNTALSAQYVSCQNDKTKAAIASKKAAKLYGLDVIKENIHHLKTNTTRFIVFGKELEKMKDASYVSIVFTTKHEVGALYQVMKIINDYQINMARIESRPLKETPWKYYFYVDFEGNLNQTSIVNAIEDMKAHTNTLRVLGNYIKK